MKCDRGQPCETCVKRGLSLSCTYVHSISNSDTFHNSQPRPSAYQKLQDKLGQLEKLIASQAKGSSAGRPSDERPAEPIDAFDSPPSISDPQGYQERPSQEASELSTRLGRMSVENGATTWVENDHWTAILDGMSELKDSLNDPQDENEYEILSPNVLKVNGPELLLGENRQVTKQEILAAIPHRPIVDRLVSQFFKSVETASMVLHIPTFLNEYEHFWDDQEQTAVLWIGLLFGIMCLAVLQQQFGFELQEMQNNADSRRLAQSYCTKISQCLVLGNYTKPAPYSIETLLLYMHVERLQSKDSETGIWILLGITLRLALRMGYHRDASHFPRLSPFHAEMRRRVWCVLFMMDAGASAQFGLPRMVPASQSNTIEPRNLLDEDIQEDMLELPSARPESVRTPVQYFVSKNKLISISCTISELKALTQPPQYAEIVRLDQVLHSTYDSIPPSLAMRPMSKSITDDPSVIVQRIFVALIFYKTKCTLHRPYLISAKADKRYTYSRTACIEAALEILHIQQILDQETQAGGRLYADRGKVTSLMRSDFLLATTILCVDLDHSITEGSWLVSQNTASDCERSQTVLRTLHNAYQTWLRSSDSSREAQKAAQILKIVLDKAEAIKTASSSTVSGGTVASMPTINSSSDLQFTNAVSILASEQASAVHAALMTTDPMLLAYLPESDTDDFLEFSSMDFEMASTRSLIMTF